MGLQLYADTDKDWKLSDYYRKISLVVMTTLTLQLLQGNIHMRIFKHSLPLSACERDDMKRKRVIYTFDTSH